MDVDQPPHDHIPNFHIPSSIGLRSNLADPIRVLWRGLKAPLPPSNNPGSRLESKTSSLRSRTDVARSLSPKNSKRSSANLARTLLWFASLGRVLVIPTYASVSVLCGNLTTTCISLISIKDASWLSSLMNRITLRLLRGGPWMILGHYLVIHQWTPEFRVSDSLPAKMVVWVHFPLMPVQYYHSEILTSLGNLIGKTVKIDYNTQHAERGKFARMAVEIDLNEPLAPSIELDGAWQVIEYENLPDLCFNCGKVGHESSCYPALHPLPVSDSQAVRQVSAPSHQPPPLSPDGFRPWMTVTRKPRRPPKEGAAKKESHISKKEGHFNVSNEKGIQGDHIRKDGGKRGNQKIHVPKMKAPTSSVLKGKADSAAANGSFVSTSASQPPQAQALGQNSNHDPFAKPSDFGPSSHSSRPPVNSAPRPTPPPPVGAAPSNPSPTLPPPGPFAQICFPPPPPNLISPSPSPPPSVRFTKRTPPSQPRPSSSLNSKGAIGLNSSLKPSTNSLKKRDLKKKDAAKELACEENLNLLSVPSAVIKETGLPCSDSRQTTTNYNTANSAGGWDLNSPTSNG
ncbi:hypothetical protein LINPERHAP1_LOCUS1987 [Linum perenne]